MKKFATLDVALRSVLLESAVEFALKNKSDHFVDSNSFQFVCSINKS